MLIRPAVATDAEQAASVLRRSIRDLCTLDHGGDADVLARWLANKTPENVRLWIAATDRRIVVAEEKGSILGVGSASNAGEITVNYVAPEARFRGVSKSIVLSLETHVRAQGHTQITLTSTRTAHAFYLSMGYRDAGEPDLWRTVTGQPMSKML